MRGPLRAFRRSGLQGAVERSGLLERVSPSLAAMASLAPPGAPRAAASRSGSRRGASDGPSSGMLTGCVQGEFFPRVNAATARVLAMEGCDVVVPRAQGCCGALSVHNGREDEAHGLRPPHDRHLRRGRRRARRGQRGRAAARR